MARSLSGSQRRNLIRGWGRSAIAASQPLLDYLRATHDAVTAGAEAGAQRSIASTSNAGQSVAFGFGADADPISQAAAVALLAEVLDVAETLAAQYPDDDEGLLAQILSLLGTKVSASHNDYSGMRT